MQQKKPRLLVFSVDVLEGQTVAFYSYEKSDGTRKSEYGEYIEHKGYEHIIKYHGVTIDHVMASGSLPEFYDYVRVPTSIDDTKMANHYWVNAKKIDKIPDLEVYLVNLHPSKIDCRIPPMDHDGVKGRQNDLRFPL